MTKLFPTILIVLGIGAAIVYAYHRSWGHVVYWTAAAILTFALTYMMGK